MNYLKEHKNLVFLSVLFLFTATLYNIITPISESDNEIGHFRYIQYLHRYRAIPSTDFVWPVEPTSQQCHSPEQLDMQNPTHQFRQPPLYYIVNSLVFFWLDLSDNWWPESNHYARHVGQDDGGHNVAIHTDYEAFPYHGIPLRVHLIRGFSTFLGLIGLLAVYATGNLLFSDPRHIGASVLTISVVFIPTYLFASAVINNDIMAASLGLWGIYFLVKSIIKQEKIRILFLSTVLLLIAVFAKYYSILILFIILIALLLDTKYIFFRLKDKLNFRHLVLFLVSFVVIVNQLPRIYDRIMSGYPGMTDSIFTRFSNITVFLQEQGSNILLEELERTYMTYWAYLGFDALLLSDRMLLITKILVVIALIGVLYQLINPRNDRTKKKLVIITILGFIAIWLTAFFLLFAGPRGRYLLPIASLIAFVMVWGINAWSPTRYPWLGGIAFSLTIFIIGITSPFTVIKPAYLPPPLIDEDALPVDAIIIQGDWGFAELIAIDIFPDKIVPGAPVLVTLTWRAREGTANNYLVGVHLSGPDGADLGGASHYPGNGNFATSLWQPGDIFKDSYRFNTVSTTDTELPLGARIKISVVCPTPEGDNHLPVFNVAGEMLGDAIYSKKLRFGLPAVVEANSSALTLGNFGNVIALVESSQISNSLTAVGPLELDLKWQALASPPNDYSVYVQLLDVRNRVMVGADYPLTQNYYPSSLWQPGELVEHRHSIDLSLASLLPSGHYRLVTGIYHLETGERLPLIHQNDQTTPEGYLLGAWDLENYLIYIPVITSGETVTFFQ